MPSAKEKYLFLLDVDNIQSYIFSTSKLKPIIGASWLVDCVNSETTPPNIRIISICQSYLLFWWEYVRDI